MKKTWIIVIAAIALVVFYSVSVYNSLVSQDESVATAWSNVENQYQRRSDLIPNLVNTVKGYAAHEKETLEAVISARSKATQTSLSIDELTPEKLQAYQNIQGEIGAALGRLMAISERYPDLKANENFQALYTWPYQLIGQGVQGGGSTDGTPCRPYQIRKQSRQYPFLIYCKRN